MKNLTTKRGLRCAIYTRVSTDQGLEQDFNSLDAQREASEAYIKSQAHEGCQTTMLSLEVRSRHRQDCAGRLLRSGRRRHAASHLKLPRNEELHPVDRPALERLGKQSMVDVGERRAA